VEGFFSLRVKGLKLALTGFLLACAFASSPTLAASAAPVIDPGAISRAVLPVQAVETLGRIRQGGPFESNKDGVVFGNRERLLPLHTRGYYREYTVMTPSVRGRGSRRIVCGGPATLPDACYYSDDHYASFRRIVD